MQLKGLFVLQTFFDPLRIFLGVPLVQFFGGIMKHALKPLCFKNLEVDSLLIIGYTLL